jgi:Icc-related predicted phosphoesterase
MTSWFFTSDLHGQVARYEKLFQAIAAQRPQAVLLGGDLLPNAGGYRARTSFRSAGGVCRLKEQLKEVHPLSS